jgi:hypothetical protein
VARLAERPVEAHHVDAADHSLSTASTPHPGSPTRWSRIGATSSRQYITTTCWA